MLKGIEMLSQLLTILLYDAKIQDDNVLLLSISREKSLRLKYFDNEKTQITAQYDYEENLIEDQIDANVAWRDELAEAYANEEMWLEYGFCDDVTDSDGNNDGDGVSDYQEYLDREDTPADPDFLERVRDEYISQRQEALEEYNDLKDKLRSLEDEESNKCEDIEEDVTDYENDIESQQALIETDAEAAKADREAIQESLDQDIEETFGYFQN